MKKQQIYRGEKYIYLLMAYNLAKQDKDSVSVGYDTGYVGGHNYWRRFTIQQYDGKTLLIEKKSSKGFADFSRVFEVRDNSHPLTPTIRDYVNEDGENCGKSWVH